MPVPEKHKLMEEYVKRFFTIFRILEVTGFCRFVIRNGKIVARSWLCMLYNMMLLMVADAGATAMLWTTNLSDEALTTVELITIVHFSIFANFLIFHITFGDKNRGLDFITNCIEIDHFLGAEETKFMRKLAVKMYIILFILVEFLQIGAIIYMYCTFHVSILIHIIGSLYFFWIFFAYDDFCFYLYCCVFVTARAWYLNVALLKITNMKIEYIPKQSFFYKLSSWDKYNDRVTFHTRAERNEFVVAFKMLFQQLRHIERIYSMPMAFGLSTLVVGTFVAVQTFIMYIEASTAMTRASTIAGWAIATWLYFLIVSLFTDMFNKQIEQTKLICAYVQLKPTSSDRMLKLTKDIIASLELRSARVSLYNITFLDPGLIFKLAASTFVYITVQLQLAFPNLEDRHKFANVTKRTSFDLHQNKIKEFLFLY